MNADPLDHLADLNRPGAHRREAKLLVIGSDVEIAGRVGEDLERAYGDVLHAEGHFWRYGQSHWEAIAEPELRLAVHVYDGARFKTPAGEPSRVKLNKSRVDSVLNELAALLAQPAFFENMTMASTAPRASFASMTTAPHTSGRTIRTTAAGIPFPAAGHPAPRVHHPKAPCSRDCWAVSFAVTMMPAPRSICWPRSSAPPRSAAPPGSGSPVR